jgi:putative ABC transport system permease protein
VTRNPLRLSVARSGDSSRPRERVRVRVRDILREGLLPLRDRPSRSLLTSLGVAVGAGAFVVTAGLQATNGAQIHTTLGNLRSTQVIAQVSLSPATSLTSGEIEQIQQGVAGSGAVSGSVSWLVDDQMPVRNTAPAAAGIPSLNLPVIAATGPVLRAAEVRSSPSSAAATLSAHQPMILVGRGIAGQLGVRLGDSLRIHNGLWTVGGFVDDSRLRPDLLLSLVVPADIALDRFGAPQELDVLLRTPPGEATVVAGRAPAALFPGEPGRVIALPVPDMGAVTAQIDDQILQAGLGVSLAAVIIGMLMTGASAYVSVLERQGELALRRSLGARPQDIGRQIAVESAATSAIGAAIGLLLGVGGVVVAGVVRDLPIVVPLQIVAVTIPLGTLSGVFAALIPARRANRVDPVTFLRRL